MIRTSGACVLAAAVLVPWTITGALYDQALLPKILVASLLGAAGSLAALRERVPERGTASRGSGGTPLAAPLAALFAAAAVSSALSADPVTSYLGAHLAYAWCLLGWLPCLVLYRLAALQEEGFEDRLAAALVLGSLGVSSFAALQAMGLDPRVGLRLPSGRVFSSLSSPVTLGAYLAAVLPLALHVARRGEPWSRKPAAAAAALAALAMYLTGSRAAWLGALAGTATYAAASEGRRSLKGRWGAVLAAAALASAAGLFVLAAERTVSDRQRLELWRVAGRLFAERPLLGVGPQGFDLASRAVYSEEYAASIGGREAQSDAHNDWLQVLCGLGLVGALAYAWLHLDVWRLWRSVEDRPGAAAYAGGLAALFVALKLNGASWTGPFFAALLTGGLAACRKRALPIAPSRAELQRPRAGRAPGAATGPGAPGQAAGPGAWAAAGAGLLAFAASGWLAAADRSAKLGVRARAEGRSREAAVRLEAAIRLRPAEAAYRQMLANLLWDVASSVEPADRAVLLRRASEVTAEGLLRRPADSRLSHLAGLAELRRFEWAGEPRLEAASEIFRHGLALDPHSAGLLEGAARAARLSGRLGEAAELETRLFRLTKKN